MDFLVLFSVSFVILIATQSQVLASKPKPGARPIAKPSSTAIKARSIGSRPSALDGFPSDSSNVPDRNPISTGNNADMWQGAPGKKAISTGDNADLLGQSGNSPNKKPVSWVGGSDGPTARPNTAVGSWDDLIRQINTEVGRQVNAERGRQVNTAFNPNDGDPFHAAWKPGLTIKPSATTWKDDARSAEEVSMKEKLREDQEDERKQRGNGSTLHESFCVLTAVAIALINTVL